jgi:uncharacterized membrane protein
MLTVDETIMIDRPRKEVWDYLLDPGNQTVWQSNLTEFDADWENEPAIGDRFRAEGKVAGRRIQWTAKVTDISRAESWAFESEDAPFPFSFRWTVDDTDAGTRVSVHGESPGFSGFFGKLAEPLVIRMFSRDLQANLENLKAILEEG